MRLDPIMGPNYNSEKAEQNAKQDIAILLKDYKQCKLVHDEVEANNKLAHIINIFFINFKSKINSTINELSIPNEIRPLIENGLKLKDLIALYEEKTPVGKTIYNIRRDNVINFLKENQVLPVELKRVMAPKNLLMDSQIQQISQDQI